MFATAGTAACCENLTANLKVCREDPRCCLYGGQQQPGALGSCTRLHLPPSPSSLDAPAPLPQHPAPPRIPVGKRSPAQPCKAGCEGRRDSRASCQGCRLARLHISTWSLSSSLWICSCFPGKPQQTADRFALKPAHIPGSAALGEQLKCGGYCGSFPGRGRLRGTANIYIFRSAHNEKRHLRSRWLELEGKLLSLFPWLQHAWCSCIRGWIPYLQKVPANLAAVPPRSAETSAGELCERAGDTTDRSGKLLPPGKVIKQQTDGYLKQVNGYSWF